MRLFIILCFLCFSLTSFGREGKDCDIDSIIEMTRETERATKKMITLRHDILPQVDNILSEAMRSSIRGDKKGICAKERFFSSVFNRLEYNYQSHANNLLMIRRDNILNREKPEVLYFYDSEESEILENFRDNIVSKLHGLCYGSSREDRLKLLRDYVLKFQTDWPRLKASINDRASIYNSQIYRNRELFRKHKLRCRTYFSKLEAIQPCTKSPTPFSEKVKSDSISK